MKQELVEMALDDIQRWDSRLVELVKDKEVNPWDINIAVLTEKYLDFINHIESLDFRIPGNAVLTASVLLRLKSDHINWKQKIHIERSKEELNWDELPIPDLNPVRRVVERKVTVFELVEALNDAFEVERSRMGKKPMINELVKINRFEISGLMDGLKSYAENLADTLPFSEFVSALPEAEFAEYDAMHYFLALLHLANESIINIEQGGWNTPIYISRFTEIVPDKELEDYGAKEQENEDVELEGE